MALTLIVGPAGSGKLEHLHRAYAEALGAGRDPVLVVPTRTAIRSARSSLLGDHAVGALLGGDVTTFDGVFRAVADSARPDAPPTLSRDRRLFVLRRLLEDARSAGALGRLATAAASPSFSLWLDRSFDRLGSALVRPSDLDAAAAPEDLGLATVYRRWWERLDELGVWDQGRLRNEAVAELDPRRASSPPALLAAWGAGRPLLVQGFDELTRAQVRLVALVAARAPVSVTLPFVDGREALEAHSRTFAELYAAASPELVVLERRADARRPECFDRLERELFSSTRTGRRGRPTERRRPPPRSASSTAGAGRPSSARWSPPSSGRSAPGSRRNGSPS